MSDDSTNDNVADLDQRRRQQARANMGCAVVPDRLTSEVAASEQSPAEFLAAWIAGVALVGTDYFV